MTEQTIPAMEARTHFGEIMKKTMVNGVSFIVEKAGIPMVAILDLKSYEQFKQLLEERDRDFEIVNQIRSKIPDMPEEEINALVKDSIQAVRKKKNA